VELKGNGWFLVLLWYAADIPFVVYPSPLLAVRWLRKKFEATSMALSLHFAQDRKEIS
jgi:hypothetical protein